MSHKEKERDVVFLLTPIRMTNRTHDNVSHDRNTRPSSVGDNVHIIDLPVSHCNHGNGSVKNQTLERESKGCYSVIFYTSMFIFVDVWRQIASYGMIYFNGSVFPMAQTELVAMAEVIKLIAFIWKLLQQGTLTSVKISFLYFVPSFIYAINSNIYFFAMHFTTPPVWNILTQLRVIFTAILYRVVFRRKISALQWTALTLLTVAIIIPQFSEFSGEQPDLQSGERNPLIAVALAVFGSILAALGPLYTEYLFKNDDRSFADMQMQLYLFGAISASFLYVVEVKYTSLTPMIIANRNLVSVLVVMCVVFTSAVGISTAYIMKRLDNIVKLYAQSVSSILMTLACVILFPKHFNLEPEFVISLLLTFCAIFLYEHKNLDWREIRDSCKVVNDGRSKSTWLKVALLIMVLSSVCMFLLLVSVSHTSLKELFDYSLGGRVMATRVHSQHSIIKNVADVKKTKLV